MRGGGRGGGSRHHRWVDPWWLGMEEWDSDGGEELLVRSYTRSFNGFAAKLTDAEAGKLSSRNDVVSVFPSTNLQLQTTRSWDFLGFHQPTMTLANNTGSDVIIGIIDTGIWSDSPSFGDRGFGPPPAKWKGVCKGGQNFTCNNKIIGARNYINNWGARDLVGHGTQAASIAAGNAVKGTSFYGLASGVARGGHPSARIAVYAVCDGTSCPAEGIIAAFDDAIVDGVDIISISIAPANPSPLDEDPVAIGAYHAANMGILTVQSAGNGGPYSSQIASVAPWLLSVAASTIYRKFETKVVLGNGKIVVGSSVNGFAPNRSKFPVIDGIHASKSKCPPQVASDCNFDCIDISLLKGKILLCESVNGYVDALEGMAEGIIYLNETPDSTRVLQLPGLQLDQPSFGLITAYYKSTSNPVATILKSHTITDPGAPIVASFSSRGPNSIVPHLLKPDVSAPGVEILAAWSPLASPSGDVGDQRQINFNVVSGTSVSCPHVAGIAAYIKYLYPNWSPSAIKSAIMTTGRVPDLVPN
ncbi:Subtilisin-like protease SBT4.4 [Linum perenne]